LIVIQFAFAFPNGIRGARSNYTYQARGAVVLRTIDQQPDQNVTYFLNVFGNPYVLRQQARTLQQHHLSVFANGGPGS
jgi:hypothetical protein